MNSYDDPAGKLLEIFNFFMCESEEYSSNSNPTFSKFVELNVKNLRIIIQNFYSEIVAIFIVVL